MAVCVTALSLKRQLKTKYRPTLSDMRWKYAICDPALSKKKQSKLQYRYTISQCKSNLHSIINLDGIMLKRYPDLIVFGCIEKVKAAKKDR